MRLFIHVSILILASTIRALACSCECEGDCSFGVTSNNSDLVALIKVVCYEDYLEDEIMGYDGRMPYSMTVEIIRTYKGIESRQTVKVWGDNGVLCRPYISNFRLGEYYLIAPNQLGDFKREGEKADDYTFFSCSTDYLIVDMVKQKAFGEFTKTRSEVGLKEFAEKFKD